MTSILIFFKFTWLPSKKKKLSYFCKEISNHVTISINMTFSCHELETRERQEKHFILLEAEGRFTMDV